MKFLILPVLMIGLVGGCASNRPDPQSNEVDPAMASNKLRQAMLAMQSGENAYALELTKQSLRLDPNYARAYSVAGLLYEKQGNDTEARAHLDRAVELAPQDSAIRNNIGNFLCSRRYYAAALEHFMAAANNPQNERPDIALTNAGLCALRSDNKAKATGYFTQAIRINAGQTVALYQLAQLSLDNGDALTASGFLQHFLTHREHSAATLELAAEIEKQLGNTHSQRALLQQLVEQFPDSEQARRADFRLQSDRLSEISMGETKSIVTASEPVVDRATVPQLTSPVTIAEPGLNHDWILARDPDHYTLQLYTSGDLFKVKNVAAELPADLDGRIMGFLHNGQTRYSLIAGDFASWSHAQQALAGLPSSLNQYHPWVRQFVSAQRVISSKGLR